MSVSHPILSRLDTGRPLLVSGDPVASLRAHGVQLHGPAALGRLLREHPSTVREHYHNEITAGVDVLCCLTADTIPRALQQIGMPFRSAALTGDAVELALDAVDLTPRPLIVAGVLGNTEVPPVAEDRIGEELGTHAARLAAAGCELILARGFGAGPAGGYPQTPGPAGGYPQTPGPAGGYPQTPGPAGGYPQTPGHETDAAFARLARRAAIVSAAMTQLPTWAVVALDWGGFTGDGLPADECARHSFDEGAQVVLFEIPSTEVGLGWVDRLLNVCAASSHRSSTVNDLSSVRHLGFAPAAGSLDPDAWAHETRRLLEAGVRVVGGGAGTTHRHLAALSGLLRGHDRQSLWPPAPIPPREPRAV